MNARQNWQALQSRLTAARSALERGDRDGALADVNAALAIDPSFLAAVSLRERIVSGDAVAVAAAAPASIQPRAPSPQPPSASPEPRPLVSTEGYAKFEQRAKRRRADRRIEAARTAIARGKLRDAAAALDEVIELDPNLPELTEVTAAFDALRRRRGRSHLGPALAAGAAFALMTFGASWLHQRADLGSRPMPPVAGLVETPAPATLEPAVDDGQPVATSGDVADAADVGVSAAPLETAPAPRPVTAAPESTPLPPSVVAAPPPQPPPQPQSRAVITESVPIAPVSRPPVQTTAVVNVPATAAPAPAPIVELPTRANDEAQIEVALQRYRSAYDGLDAREAREVWPAVNETALARAFDSLQSQSLTFNNCNVVLNGNQAAAICHGTARYVPKVGSREPRIEPRSWTFALRKAGAEWKIESARAER